MSTKWPWRVWTSSLLGFLSLAFGWALITPLTAAPDEPSHMINAAAVVRGQWIVATSTEQDAEGIALHEVTVPEYVANTLSEPGCYVFQPAVPATCRAGSGGDELVDVNNPVANYPPLYYLLVGIPTLFLSGDAALYGMRFVGAVLSGVLFATGLTAIVTRLGMVTAMVAAAVITPMTLYLAGTVNPQSLEIVAAFALASVLFTFSVNPVGDRRMLILGAVAVAALVLSRPVGAVWAAAIVLVASTLLDRRQWKSVAAMREFWWTVSIGVVVAGGATVWQFVARPGDSLRPVPVPGVDSFADLIDYTVTNAAGYWKAAIGNLGWLDTNPTRLAIIAFSLCYGLVVLVGLVRSSGRAVLGILSLLLAVPVSIVLLQYPSLDVAGVIWQGRYSLPLLTAAGVLAALHSQRPVERVVVAILVGGLAAVAHISVLTTGVERFYSGLGNGLTAEHITAIGWVGLAFWAGGASVWIGAVLSAVFRARRRQG